VHWLRRAIELSKNCLPSTTAYNVGAVIVGADGDEIASGYSRETDPHVHAEESALGKVAQDDPRLAGATIYSSLEPCSERRSRHVPCARLILRAGIPRVVIAWREPGHFVADAQGAEVLHDAGVTVVEVPELEDAAKAHNRHLPPEMTGT
jgi:diaminohydroxyphosphoribosylaminopyrimidine deaminase/5-amino-6-(5-phosphoribosylamino)uracil reductase